MYPYSWRLRPYGSLKTCCLVPGSLLFIEVLQEHLLRILFIAFTIRDVLYTSKGRQISILMENESVWITYWNMYSAKQSLFNKKIAINLAPKFFQSTYEPQPEIFSIDS
jgi:transcriptional regulator of nitric oxide reductase